MRVSIGSILLWMLLVATSIQVWRTLHRHLNLANYAAYLEERNREGSPHRRYELELKIGVYEKALSADSPRELLDLAKERHAALLANRDALEVSP